MADEAPKEERPKEERGERRRSKDRDERPRDRDDGRRRDRDRSRERRRSRSRDRRDDRSRDRSRRSRSRDRKSRSPSPRRERKKKPSNFSSAPPEGGAPVIPGYPAMMAMMQGAMGGGMGGAAPNPMMAALMGGMGMGGAMPVVTGNLDQSTKTLRELFVGNTPEGTQEGVLMEFLNQALRQVNLATGTGNPIIQCRVSQKFAFIELRSIEEANAALNITGIPFGGNMLKIGRPSKYVGPVVPASTWQQLTGVVVAEGSIDPSTKVYRELFIGNTTEQMNEVELQDFLGAAMQQVGLTTSSGTPIVATRMSGKFAFVEVRSIEETNNMLNLNGIPYCGQNLRVGRPSKYAGPVVPHMDWNELLVKFQSGELASALDASRAAAQSQSGAMGGVMGGMMGAPVLNAAAAAVAAAPATKVVKLGNMVTAEDVADDGEHAEIVEDTKDECGKFGSVQNVIIPRNGQPGTGFVFVSFAEEHEAAAAATALAGRTFDGKRVEASFYDEARFAAGDYSA